MKIYNVLFTIRLTFFLLQMPLAYFESIEAFVLCEYHIRVAKGIFLRPRISNSDQSILQDSLKRIIISTFTCLILVNMQTYVTRTR